MRVRVDDARDRFVGDGLDALEERRPEAGKRCIDERHAGVGDEDGGFSFTFSILVAAIAAADGPAGAWP